RAAARRPAYRARRAVLEARLADALGRGVPADRRGGPRVGRMGRRRQLPHAARDARARPGRPRRVARHAAADQALAHLAAHASEDPPARSAVGNERRYVARRVPEPRLALLVVVEDSLPQSAHLAGAARAVSARTSPLSTRGRALR